MRVYIEAREDGEGGEFVRLDVTGKTAGEQDAILTSLKDFMTGVSCKFTKHYCYHEDRSNTPCQAEEV